MNNYDFLTTNEQLGIPIAPCRGIPHSGRILLMESRTKLKESSTSTEKDWNPGHWNSESTVWNPGSKTVLDFLTWGDPQLKKKYKIRLILLVIN